MSIKKLEPTLNFFLQIPRQKSSFQLNTISAHIKEQQTTAPTNQPSRQSTITQPPGQGHPIAKQVNKLTLFHQQWHEFVNHRRVNFAAVIARHQHLSLDVEQENLKDHLVGRCVKFADGLDA
jgi:hypothetical protein